MTARSCSAFAWLLLVLAGCGSGVSRYDLQGSVTYQGKPVPAGEVTFSPDTSKGNSGPGAFARIKDGKYQTEDDMGIVGGPHVVRILGLDGKAVGESTYGLPLFPEYTTHVDFPKEDSTHDFTVTKEEAAAAAEASAKAAAAERRRASVRAP